MHALQSISKPCFWVQSLRWISAGIVWYSIDMSTTKEKQRLDDHLRPTGAPSADPDYLAAKEAKIRKGLEQAKNRAALIPAHAVWDDLDLER